MPLGYRHFTSGPSLANIVSRVALSSTVCFAGRPCNTGVLHPIVADDFSRAIVGAPCRALSSPTPAESSLGRGATVAAFPVGGD